MSSRVFFARREGDGVAAYDFIGMGAFYTHDDDGATIQDGWITVRADDVPEAMRIAREYFIAQVDKARQMRRERGYCIVSEAMYSSPAPTKGNNT
jgi:hypothetical protein